MTHHFEISGLDCICVVNGADRIAYVLYPLDGLDKWAERTSKKYGVTIVVITGMDWQNVFSPWPAAGVPKGTPDFKGEAPQFLRLLQPEVVATVEKSLGISPIAERTLVGVSMSGLFALWQWMQCSTFHNIASLSGSFWYENFIKWFREQRVPSGKGKAFFLLGLKEPDSKIKSFDSVGANTQEIVSRLTAAGVNTTFEWVPGNHFSAPISRLDRAFESLYT